MSKIIVSYPFSESEPLVFTNEREMLEYLKSMNCKTIDDLLQFNYEFVEE